MLHKTKKLLLASREKLLSLALLPAFFLGTLPQTACICADGHREASCPMMRAQPSRSCCQKQASPQRNCCKNCSAKRSKPGTTCILAPPSSSCCHPVIEGPAAATVIKQTKSVEQSAQIAPAAATPFFLLAAQIWPTIAPAIDSTPPPRDVVIELSRLTI